MNFNRSLVANPTQLIFQSNFPYIPSRTVFTGSVFSVVVIDVGNGIGYPGLNSGQTCLRFILGSYNWKGMKQSIR